MNGNHLPVTCGKKVCVRESVCVCVRERERERGEKERARARECGASLRNTARVRVRERQLAGKTLMLCDVLCEANSFFVVKFLVFFCYLPVTFGKENTDALRRTLCSQHLPCYKKKVSTCTIQKLSIYKLL